jgi:hypothetical protein
MRCIVVPALRLPPSTAVYRLIEAVQEQDERAVAWLAALSPFGRLLKSGLFSLKFQWLST